MKFRIILMTGIYLCLFHNGARAQNTMPNELAILKAAFQKKVEEVKSTSTDELNEKYVVGLGKMKDKAQADGDLETLLALTKEMKSIEESGVPDESVTLKDEAFTRMREIYATELRKIHNAKVSEFESEKAKYLVTLENLVVELTKASRLEDALAVRSEAKAAATMTLASVEKAAVTKPVLPAQRAQGRQGVLRGFGRLTKNGNNPNWEDFDLSALQQYDDFVEIEGNAYGILFRRANGDVLNLKGELVGRRGKRLFASYDDGAYMNTDGKFHTKWGNFAYWGRIGELAKVASNADSFYGINTRGELVWWGPSFDRRNRMEPPERARQDLKDIGVYYDQVYALTTAGEVIGWDRDKELDVPSKLAKGVRTIAMNGWRAFFVNQDNELLGTDGELLSAYYDGPVEYVLEGGEFAAVLTKQEGWRLTCKEFEKPLGNEIPVANVVMNRPETIDVDFHLANGRNHDLHPASFLVWIEEVGAPPLDVKDVGSLPAPPATPRQPGSGFFGVEID